MIYWANKLRWLWPPSSRYPSLPLTKNTRRMVPLCVAPRSQFIIQKKLLFACFSYRTTGRRRRRRPNWIGKVWEAVAMHKWFLLFFLFNFYSSWGFYCWMDKGICHPQMNESLVFPPFGHCQGIVLVLLRPAPVPIVWECCIFGSSMATKWHKGMNEFSGASR